MKVYKQGVPLIKELNNTRIHDDTISFWNLGQAGILIKGREEDGLICIDSYLSNSIEQVNPETEFKRAYPPVLSPDMLEDADAILITHEHDDHLDFATLREVGQSSENPVFVVPAPLVSMVQSETGNNNIAAAKVNESFQIKGFQITPVPAAHTSYQVDLEGNHHYLGFCIEVNGVRLFHSGDTIVTPELIEKVKDFKPHVVFLPINGGDYFRSSREIVGNMSFREAVEFSNTVGADLIIPIHYDLFPNNRDNPAYFVDYLFTHYPNQKFHMMAPGERFIYHL
ncbi:L-ascorbate metabolism protein UlaG (beta-lactamase superfamily) [Bacillus niacini]|uniref:L-ascorbate metabolism protein UlaG (Beta-lactamase superfamily) n=1 Tax=Neobacillus niacini TaxID=86668 RepID=A0A852TJG1_9BACI|nr:MBL fold metallo-hydrolase [Neobacillus niacini]NYE09130.1 L-ascorbate metabolism protein UlaG (beta-lactamase superfamily) [Neobacillus niacini]